eukprot:4900477-Amphidinium_carterae.3
MVTVFSGSSVVDQSMFTSGTRASLQLQIITRASSSGDVGTYARPNDAAFLMTLKECNSFSTPAHASNTPNEACGATWDGSCNAVESCRSIACSLAEALSTNS